MSEDLLVHVDQPCGFSLNYKTFVICAHTLLRLTLETFQMLLLWNTIS